MSPDYKNRVGAPPTRLIVPGSPVPKPAALTVQNVPMGATTMPRPVPPAPKTTPAFNPTDERTCYVQNSKNGDILNILPLLYQKFRETGQKQVLLVSKAYESLLFGCSYIETMTWDGDWTDLNGALQQAQARFKTVVSLSTFGKALKPIKQTPSFALEQWRLGGALELYGDVPLVFDQRNQDRETMLVNKHVKENERFILFADHSQSSPFDQMDALIQLLQTSFGATHKILRLSEVHADQVYDLLGLYERAAALVSIETMHLHLAAASGVPVVALVTDKPEIWHGTAWRPNFWLQIRYGDYQQRWQEIVTTIQDAINLRELPLMEITGKGGYNQTMMDWNGQRVAVYRWHPKADSWRTELAAWTGTKTVRVIPPSGLEQHSIEDGRLFKRSQQGAGFKLCLSYTVATQKGCVIQYGELDTTGEDWRIVNSFQPKYENNDFTRMQKNWSFWEWDGKLYAAYERGPEQTILQLAGNDVTQVFKTKSPQWAWGQVRGGTAPIERSGLWLQFFHSSTRNPKTAWGWTYYMGALLMETAPPFQIVSISRFPIMAGTERYFPINHWKPRILFPAGAVKSGEDYLVSLGVNDSATGKVLLTDADLNL
jgi:predicted GH43/DUF377 family glycosyl hydrolase